MLVGHEVGHALYTPDEEWWKEHKVPPSFVNITEDVRIEKLMKRRYAGLSKSCLLYTSPSPRDATLSRMPSSA